MKYAVLIAANCLLVYLLFFSRLEKSSISIGPFSFSFLHDARDNTLTRAIQYIESYDIDPRKSKSVLVSLEQLYFQETASKSIGSRAFDSVLALLNHESRKHQLRRLFASLYARKMGLLHAAEAEVRANLDEKVSCADLIFLGEILSLRSPNDNAEILKPFRQAISLPACKRDGANYQTALGNVRLREGHMLFAEGQFSEAAKHYLQVIQSNPRSYAAYNSLANSYASTGQIVDALNYYDKAIIYSTSEADSSLATFLKARVLYSLAEKPDRLSPENRTITLNDAMKSADLAVRLVETEHSAYPIGSFERQSLADKLLLRGKIYCLLGDRVSAKNDFSSCLKSTFEPDVRIECERRLAEM